VPSKNGSEPSDSQVWPRAVLAIVKKSESHSKVLISLGFSLGGFSIGCFFESFFSFFYFLSLSLS
jgi:hypothetical protein